jgi:hypothetical protein
MYVQLSKTHKILGHSLAAPRIVPDMNEKYTWTVS